MNKDKIQKNIAMKTIDNSDEVLELANDFMQIITITSIPFDMKLYYYNNTIIMAYDLMLDDWRWYELCRVTDNALFQLETFCDIKEIRIND